MNELLLIYKVALHANYHHNLVHKLRNGLNYHN